MKQKNTARKAAFLAGASFAGYNIGSGFATGIEGQQFFAAWGASGALTGLIAAFAVLLLVLLPVYLTGYKKREDGEYNVYHHYCGKAIGCAVDWYIYLTIFVIILTMMSGAGATIEQLLGIPKAIGAILLGVLCVAAALLGLEKLMRVLSGAGIVIFIIMLIGTAYLTFVKGITVPVGRETADAVAASGKVLRIGLFGLSSPLFGGFLSAGLVIVSGMPWVASTGSLCPDKKSAILSGVLSALLFYLAEAVAVWLNLVSLDRIAGKEIPILAVFQEYFPPLAAVYSVVILLAIFSTVTGRLYLFSSRIDKGNKKVRTAVSVGVVILAAVGGIILPFSLISNLLFTASGCLGLFLGVCILVRTVWELFRKRTMEK